MTETQKLVLEALEAYEQCLKSVQLCFKAAIVASKASVEAAEVWVETEKIRAKIMKREEAELSEAKQIITGVKV